MNTMPKLIGLTGAAGAGKSTLGRALRLEDGFRVVSFAGPLKRMMEAIEVPDVNIYGRPDQKAEPLEMLGGKSARFAMQTLGTEWGRQCMGEDFWVKLWSSKVSRLIKNDVRVVVDDVRFQNEVDAVRALGGVVVRIKRPGLVAPINGAAGHASEQTDSLSVDYDLDNDGPEYVLKPHLLIKLAGINVELQPKPAVVS